MKWDIVVQFIRVSELSGGWCSSCWDNILILYFKLLHPFSYNIYICNYKITIYNTQDITIPHHIFTLLPLLCGLIFSFPHLPLRWCGYLAIFRVYYYIFTYYNFLRFWKIFAFPLPLSITKTSSSHIMRYIFCNEKWNSM